MIKNNIYELYYYNNVQRPHHVYKKQLKSAINNYHVPPCTYNWYTCTHACI